MRTVLLILLAGCAPLPPCQTADAIIVQVPDGSMLIGFTPEAMQVWHDTIRAEARGQCRVVKKGET